jgi:hypothetical protein
MRIIKGCTYCLLALYFFGYFEIVHGQINTGSGYFYCDSETNPDTEQKTCTSWFEYYDPDLGDDSSLSCPATVKEGGGGGENNDDPPAPLFCDEECPPGNYLCLEDCETCNTIRSCNYEIRVYNYEDPDCASAFLASLASYSCDREGTSSNDQDPTCTEGEFGCNECPILPDEETPPPEPEEDAPYKTSIQGHIVMSKESDDYKVTTETNLKIDVITKTSGLTENTQATTANTQAITENTNKVTQLNQSVNTFSEDVQQLDETIRDELSNDVEEGTIPEVAEDPVIPEQVITLDGFSSLPSIAPSGACPKIDDVQFLSVTLKLTDANTLICQSLGIFRAVFLI